MGDHGVTDVCINSQKQKRPAHCVATEDVSLKEPSVQGWWTETPHCKPTHLALCSRQVLLELSSRRWYLPKQNVSDHISKRRSSHTSLYIQASSDSITGLRVEEQDTVVSACKSTNNNTPQVSASLVVSHPTQQKQPKTNLFQLTKTLLERSARTLIPPLLHNDPNSQCTLTENRQGLRESWNT